MPLHSTQALPGIGPSYIGTKLLYEQGGYESTRSCTAPEVEEVLMSAMRDLLGIQA